jgi:DNA end-binding protein Ku
MPRAIWSGSISFGLVNVPVRMYSAVQESDVRFHLVHAPDGGRIGYRKMCKEEDREVPDDEIVKAYETDDGSLVYMSDEDFEAAQADGGRTIDIEEFVPYEQIDPIYFEHTYYLGPAERGEKVYALFARAMEEKGLAAVARYVMRERQHLGCLRIRDGVVTLERMYFADEIREPDDLRPGGVKVDRRELRMATELIDRFTGDFRPDRYSDTYRDALLDVIERKRRGEEVHARAPEREERPDDLMAALEASLAEARGGRRGGRGGGASRRSGGGRGRRGGGEDLSRLTRKELDQRARKAGVEGRSKMSKDELAAALADVA